MEEFNRHIEEVIAKCTKELENEIREEGEKAVFETGIGKVHPELVKMIGRLKFRTSYGQNALAHSRSCLLAGKLAAEIGENEMLATCWFITILVKPLTMKWKVATLISV